MILVTGGAGYIGTHTCVELLNKGFDIVVVDNFVNSHPLALERVKQITGKDFPFYNLDVCNKEALDKVFATHKPDTVIHFAGLKAVGESVAKPLSYYENNILSTTTLLKCMQEHGARNIIFSSSATVYNANNTMPLTEESVTGGCTNPYGWTKYMCEQIITDAAKANGNMSAVLLRYFNPVGAHKSGRIGEDPQGIPNNLMPYVSQVAVGKLKELPVTGNDYDTVDGTGVRDYLHVVDLATGHVASVKYAMENSGTAVFNLGTGNGSSVLQMVTAFEKANNIKVPYRITARRPGDIATCYASCKKAETKLNWKAEKTIEEMCRDLWNWQSNNPKGYSEE